MQEKSLIKKNILQFIEIQGISKYKFYKETGITRGVLDQNNGLNEENIARFIAYYPNVNADWLITGKGEMLKKENVNVDKSELEDLRRRVREQSQLIDFLNHKISTLEKSADRVKSEVNS